MLVVQKKDDMLLVQIMSAENPHLYNPGSDLNKPVSKIQEQTRSELGLDKMMDALINQTEMPDDTRLSKQIKEYLSSGEIKECHLLCIGFLTGICIDIWSQYLHMTKVLEEYPDVDFVLHISEDTNGNDMTKFAQEAYGKEFKLDFSQEFNLGGVRYGLDMTNSVNRMDRI